MSKVYVLFEYEYGSLSVLRIFSTEAKALLYKEVLQDTNSDKTYTIDEYEVKD